MNNSLKDLTSVGASNQEQSSNFAKPRQIGGGGGAGLLPETSNIGELSQSVLCTPNMLSNFNKKRGFLGVNQLLQGQPTFNPEKANLLANDKPSSTGLLNGQLGAGQEMSSATQVIWGTNINTSDVQMKLKNFINNFEVVKDEDDSQDMNDEAFCRAPHYIEKLREVKTLDLTTLDIDCDHLFQYDQGLYRQIEDYPADIIPIFDLVVTQVFKELDMYNIGDQGADGDQNMQFDDFGQNDQIIQVRPHNLRKIHRIRELGPSNIDKLVSVRGIVIRNGDIVPEMKEACFVCCRCQREEMVAVHLGRIQQPSICSNCNQRDTFSIQHNMSIFSDKQHVKVQESPESIPEGETPQTIHLCAYEDLVDDVKPGDRVEITGIYKAMGVRVNQNKRTLKNVYRTYIDVITYVKTDKRRLDTCDKDGQTDKNEKKERLIGEEEGEVEAGLNEEHQTFTEQEVEKFKEFAKRKDVYDILVDSLAPSIWECQDVKKGILCQLFGGVSKEFSQSGKGRFRGEINVLLCGDPSTAKSQLLQYVHKLAPRGIYTSGKGSSAVGLTVYITKDPETKELVLESGALVLSDRGICCIDEFDKMDDNTRTILHEAMEQQTVSVAKAGIICTLNARTAILAAANPIESKYNPKMSVVQNLRLPPTLLSRFDLIYLILDKQTEQQDRRLANHIVSLYSSLPSDANVKESNEDTSTTMICTNKTSRNFLARYISYARKHVNPEIPDSIVDSLVQEYMRMRSSGDSRHTVTATPRQLESLIRIAEANAKMRLSPQLEPQDVEEAVRLIRAAMQQSATDPTTGMIDLDIITTGVSRSSASRVKEISNIIKGVQEQFADKVNLQGIKQRNLFEYLQAKAKEGILGQVKEIYETEFNESLIALEEEGVISRVGHKRAPTIRWIQQ